MLGLWAEVMLCRGVGLGDWPQVFPCSMISLALGLYVVSVWCSSLVNDSLRDVFTIYWGPEEHFVAWGELWESMSSMGLVELCSLCLFVGEEVISDTLHVHWLAGSTRALEGPVVQGLTG